MPTLYECDGPTFPAAYGTRISGPLPAGLLALHGVDHWPSLDVVLEPDPEPLPAEHSFATLVGSVCLSKDLDRVRLPVAGSCDLDLAVHPLLSTAAWMRARLLGLEVLHAGAVLTERGAWLVLADKEGGKSTLLARLNAAGLPVVADDMAIIDAGRVYSGPRCLDLRPDMGRALGMGRSVRSAGTVAGGSATSCRRTPGGGNRGAAMGRRREGEGDAGGARGTIVPVVGLERATSPTRPPRDAGSRHPALLPRGTTEGVQRHCCPADRGCLRRRGTPARSETPVGAVTPETAAKLATEMGADVVVWQAHPTVRGPDRWLRELALAAHGATSEHSSTHASAGKKVITTVCAYCGQPGHGKPRLVEQRGCYFNTSYAADLTLVAVGTGEVGIDVAEIARLDALDLDAIDAATRGALSAVARTLPKGMDPRVGWTVFEAVAKGLGMGLAARASDIEEALTSWSITSYQPTATTVACLATAIAHPVVMRATVAPSTLDVAVLDTVSLQADAGGN